MCPLGALGIGHVWEGHGRLFTAAWSRALDCSSLWCVWGGLLFSHLSNRGDDALPFLTMCVCNMQKYFENHKDSARGAQTRV